MRYWKADTMTEDDCPVNHEQPVNYEKLEQARLRGVIDRREGKPCRPPSGDDDESQNCAAMYKVGWSKDSPREFADDDGQEFIPGPGGVDIAEHGGDGATRERRRKGRVVRGVHIGSDGKRAIAERVRSTSPLDYCRARQCISQDEWVAGRRFIGDWRKAGYDAVQAAPMVERVQRGKYLEPDSRLSAQRTVMEAMKEVGKINTGVAKLFLIDEQNFGQIEKIRRWPARSAKGRVVAVLTALGKFYRELDEKTETEKGLAR